MPLILGQSFLLSLEKLVYNIGCSFNRGVAQMARALRLGRRGREFESHRPDTYRVFESLKMNHVILLKN